MGKFKEAFEIVLGHEGGLSLDPQDLGNWTGGKVGKGELKGTKFGISARSYPNHDIKNLTVAQAMQIYKRDYWDRIYGDFLPPALGLVAFDTAVNSGLSKSREFLYQTHSAGTFLALRRAYVDKLVEKPQFAKYKNGWQDRLSKLGEQIAQWEVLYSGEVVPTFCYPVLPWKNYSVQPGLGFLSPSYLVEQKAQHTGTDYNGLGGGDTDLGDNVLCVSHGIVKSVSYHNVIGNAIVIRHTPELESVYWHVQNVDVKPGQAVEMGQKIAEIGKGANGKFRAHLHFELRKVVGLPPDEWPSTTMNPAQAEEYIASNRYNSETFFKAVKAKQSLPVVVAPEKVKVYVDGKWENVGGQTYLFEGLVINAADPNTVWIRRQ